MLQTGSEKGYPTKFPDLPAQREQRLLLNVSPKKELAPKGFFIFPQEDMIKKMLQVQKKTVFCL